MSHIEDLNKTGDLGKTITHLKAIVAEHEERIRQLESVGKPPKPKK